MSLSLGFEPKRVLRYETLRTLCLSKDVFHSTRTVLFAQYCTIAIASRVVRARRIRIPLGFRVKQDEIPCGSNP